MRCWICFSSSTERFRHTYIHSHANTYWHIHIHTHTYTHIHIYTHTHTHIPRSISRHPIVRRKPACTDTHRHIHIHTHTHVYTFTHTHTYTRIHIYTHPPRSISRRPIVVGNRPAQTHTDIYTFTHIHTDASEWCPLAWKSRVPLAWQPSGLECRAYVCVDVCVSEPTMVTWLWKRALGNNTCWFVFIHSHARESKFCSGEDTLECIEALHAEFRDAPTNSKKSIFLKKSGLLGQSQNIFWYFVLTILLENHLEITHVDF